MKVGFGFVSVYEKETAFLISALRFDNNTLKEKVCQNQKYMDTLASQIDDVDKQFRI